MLAANTGLIVSIDDGVPDSTLFIGWGSSPTPLCGMMGTSRSSADGDRTGAATVVPEDGFDMRLDRRTRLPISSNRQR